MYTFTVKEKYKNFSESSSRMKRCGNRSCSVWSYALYRSITEWLLEDITCRYYLSRVARTANFLARQEAALGAFSVFFHIPSPSRHRESIGDSRGYKKRACRGLFRDRGSFNFRETRRIAESPLQAVTRSGWRYEKY